MLLQQHQQQQQQQQQQRVSDGGDGMYKLGSGMLLQHALALLDDRTVCLTEGTQSRIIATQQRDARQMQIGIAHSADDAEETACAILGSNHGTAGTDRWEANASRTGLDGTMQTVVECLFEPVVGSGGGFHRTNDVDHTTRTDSVLGRRYRNVDRHGHSGCSTALGNRRHQRLAHLGVSLADDLAESAGACE
jgi:hypothetical protein